MNETRELARFVAETTYEDIPRDITEYAKIFLLDNFACGFIGSVQPWSKMVADMVRDSASKEECTLFGQNWRTDLSGAALVNGVMIGAFESEHADPIGVHPGGNVFPALMAIAERDHADGKAFITALVLAYEVVVRIGEAATRAVEDERGFHGPATNGAFGAAVAVGKILGFDQATLVNAMGIAGSHGGGLMEFKWEGTMTKRLHLGRGGQMGLESALLAARGFTGPSTVIEGKFGYLNVFSPSPKPEWLLKDLGKSWFGKSLQFIKPISVHGSQLAIAYGLNEFKMRHPIDPKKIRKATVIGSHRMKHGHEGKEPTSIMGAQYSMPFVAAITLLKDIADPYIFNEETLWDPEVRDLAKRIDAAEDKQFDAYGTFDDPRAQVIIDMEDERLVVDIAGFKGLTKTPFDFDDVCGKFRRYGTPIVGTQKIERMIEIVRRIEELDDISRLIELIAP